MSETPEIQMVDLTGQYQRLKSPIDEAMARVLMSGRYINGPEVRSFSEALSEYLGVKHVIPCGNGTDALQAALMALNLNPGDEVITTSFSFIATVEVIALLGLKPVLVDVDPDTYNIDPELVREAVTPRTKAVIPVHLFGQSAAMEDIMLIAREYGLNVIEDAAQSLGADYKLNGSRQMLGTIGDIGCTSFFPTKNLGCFGDGGACFTDDDALAEKLRMIVNHGAKKKYMNEIVGVNSRLDTLQAAVLNEKIKHLDDFVTRRRQAAAYYYEALKDLSFLQLPLQISQGEHSFNQFTIRVPDDRRDELKQYLSDSGIPGMVYYPSPLHKQPVFEDHGITNQSLPVSEMLCEQVLSLPLHTEMTEEQLEFITTKIRQFS
ncbi:DegT/DnrJ/EryC1/StrS family aminotransferase [Marinilabilia rubra]|uniref:Transcriptional regulator n=1 Tax=Marinilabilia rubra TaxID=2162893 RepID=A0A2U2BBA2_9BACT|nr:DegT/DnrJ/EryC1/StrS family aminotransferase [Marinilabilia rubra]PWE00340.1 transcriptional regulator [Marinilabilia rubra]